jgi:hypothetical protein
MLLMNSLQVSETQTPPARQPGQKKRWSDFSPRQQTAIILGGIAELIITTIAVRDLRRRPTRQVRGWKFFWLLACAVQPVGPIAYLLVGRRRTDA